MKESNLTELPTIPFQTYALLRNIDPALEEGWQTTVLKALKNLSDQSKKIVFDNQLAPKNIFWDSNSNSLVFRGNITIFQIKNNLSHPKLNALCEKIYQSFTIFDSVCDIASIADFIEGALGLIDHYDVEDNILLQQEKLKLRKAFLYDCAARIKVMDFNIPDSQRDLNNEIVKDFFINVYIKHQLLGYWFKTLPHRDLQKINHLIFKDFIATEAKTRQLELIKTSHHIFLVGSVRTIEQNPYSIRRFLSEESSLTGNFIYFNVVALDLKKINAADYLEKFKWQTSRIITIQRHISQHVSDLIESIDLTQQNVLKPLLFKALSADGFTIDKAIEQKLLDYEKILTVHVLEKVNYAIDHLAKHNDDFDYLFFGLRTILIELLSDIQIFSQQPAMRLSMTLRSFECRLVSYIKLLEKRKSSIFCINNLAEESEDLEHETPIKELKNLVEAYIQNIGQSTLQLKNLQREMRKKQQSKGFFNKIFKSGDSPEIKANQLAQKIAEQRIECFIEIIKIPKIYPHFSVYLEFESLISVSEKERNYAFPRGKKGITLLPLLIKLPEDRSRFNLLEIRQMLSFDIFTANQKWSEDIESTLSNSSLTG